MLNRIFILMFILVFVGFTGDFGSLNPKDTLGKTPKYSLFGDAFQAYRYPQVTANFTYSVDPGLVTTTVSGTADVYHENSTAVLETSASTSSARVQSKQTVLYRTNYESEAAFTAAFTTCTAGSTQFIGLGDGSSGGIYIGCNGDTFGIMHDDGVADPTFIAQADWNKHTGTSNRTRAGFIIDHTKLNIYRISYAWFGVAPIIVEVFGGMTYGWQTLHVFNYPNTRTYPHLKNPSLPIFAEVSSDTCTSTIVLRTASWGASNIGVDSEIGYRRFAFSHGATVSTEAVIASGRVTSTFQGKASHIPAKLKFVAATTDGNKPAYIKIYRNATLSAGAWNNYSSADSIMNYKINGTMTGGTLVDGFAISPALSNQRDLDFIMYPNDTITITASSSVSSLVSMVVSWIEEF